MIQKCWHCKEVYIEEDEEICVDCAVFFSDENNYVDNLFDEQIVDDIDGDRLNDIGASLSEKDF